MNKLKLIIESSTADGRLSLLINGNRYHYQIDAAHLEEVDRLYRLRRLKDALDLVKRVQTFYRKDGE